MPRLMIVDDAAFMRAIIKNMIARYEEYEVVAEACDGLDAVAKYKEFKPDVVTMDITMPNMTGIEAVREIKKINGDAKVVMVSAMGQEVLIKESIISGASSFIVKPFKVDKLIEVLDGILK